MNTITNKLSVSNFKVLSNTEFTNLKLTQNQKEILFGLLLGDLYLQTQNKGKTYRMRVQQNYELHGNYVLHLFDIFKPFCSSLPDKVARTKNNTIDCRFQTKGHSEFVEFGQMFYDTGKKHLPSYDYIYKRLTPLALAYWYMDDGGIDGANPRGCSINTHSFTDQETEMLIDILIKKYQLTAKSRTNKGKKIIVVSAQSCEKFNSLIWSNTVKCMYYKIPGYKKKMT